MGAVRLFLAYVVAVGHWNAIVARQTPMDDWVTAGFNAGYAVMFFYIISGFLMTYTLTVKYQDGNTAAFYENRFIRIFSLYWPVVAISLLVIPNGLTHFVNASAIDKATRLFIFGQDWSVTLGKPGGQYFGGTPDLLHQSWTLGAELTFYLFIPWLLNRPRLVAALLASSLLIRAAFVWHYWPKFDGNWTYTFFPTTVCFFFLGYFAAKASFAWAWINERMIWWLGIPAIGAVMYFGSRIHFDALHFWSAVLIFTAVLPSLFMATKNSKALNAIGDFSFPLYLTHILVMNKTHAWITATGWSNGEIGRYVTLFMFAAVAIAASAIVHYAIERPSAAGLRALMNHASSLWSRRRRSIDTALKGEA